MPPELPPAGAAAQARPPLPAPPSFWRPSLPTGRPKKSGSSHGAGGRARGEGPRGPPLITRRGEGRGLGKAWMRPSSQARQRRPRRRRGQAGVAPRASSAPGRVMCSWGSLAGMPLPGGRGQPVQQQEPTRVRAPPPPAAPAAPPQGIDLKAGGRNCKKHRDAPKSDNVYLKLLVKVRRGRGLRRRSGGRRGGGGGGGGAASSGPPHRSWAGLELHARARSRCVPRCRSRRLCPPGPPPGSCTASWSAAPRATSTRSCSSACS
jgi:hypothetical protein